jgi:hypothetical protein
MLSDPEGNCDEDPVEKMVREEKVTDCNAKYLVES